ncbi:MAG: hypothetical protein QW705_01025 [Zestosphaera sp.]
MKPGSLRKHYILASIIVMCLFYIIPYMFLRKVLGFELFAFWVGLSLTWLTVTNILLIGDLA